MLDTIPGPGKPHYMSIAWAAAHNLSAVQRDRADYDHLEWLEAQYNAAPDQDPTVLDEFYDYMEAQGLITSDEYGTHRRDEDPDYGDPEFSRYGYDNDPDDGRCSMRDHWSNDVGEICYG
jgi:hypothetical protein